MATGDKIYLADKETLDAMNTKVGATTDTGGSATAGSIFAKLNAIISSFASHVANWTAAKAAHLDAAISTRESEESAASRHTALISAINTGTAGINKRLTAKKLTASIPGETTMTVLNITGAGVFYGGYISANNISVRCVITIDGVEYGLHNSNAGAFGRVINLPQMFYVISTGNVVIPVEFKESVVIEVQAKTNTAVNFYCDYSLYE